MTLDQQNTLSWRTFQKTVAPTLASTMNLCLESSRGYFFSNRTSLRHIKRRLHSKFCIFNHPTAIKGNLLLKPIPIIPIIDLYDFRQLSTQYNIRLNESESRAFPLSLVFSQWSAFYKICIVFRAICF